MMGKPAHYQREIGWFIMVFKVKSEELTLPASHSIPVVHLSWD